MRNHSIYHSNSKCNVLRLHVMCVSHLIFIDDLTLYLVRYIEPSCNLLRGRCYKHLFFRKWKSVVWEIAMWLWAKSTLGGTRTITRHIVKSPQHIQNKCGNNNGETTMLFKHLVLQQQLKKQTVIVYHIQLV